MRIFLTNLTQLVWLRHWITPC